MNILVTGACGQVGREIARRVRERAVPGVLPTDRYIFSDIIAPRDMDIVLLDVTQQQSVECVCASEEVDLVVNCAAFTDVDKAEEDRAMADSLNRVAPAVLAEVCARRGARLIHLSTDYVFDGVRSEAYKEYCPTSPVNFYGRTKAFGEEALRASACSYMVLRTQWLYSPWGKNFLKTILRLSSVRDSIKVVSDQIGTPTSATDVADFIMGVVQRRDFGHFATPGGPSDEGIFHFSDEGVASWYDFAHAVVQMARIRDKAQSRLPRCCEVLPCHTGEFPSRAVRPLFTLLDKTKVKDAFGVPIPHWRDSLEECFSRVSM